MPPSSTARPSAKQLAYLKALADRTATSFAYPHDRDQASREIERLRQLPAAERSDRRDDRDRAGYGTAPQPDEIVGYGSSARWRTHGGRR
ncbi:MAG TPA: hypothetical protein VMD79_14000 [Solirubrobacteraceae bacterium]|nr:hypothetical protein [Solirubrobacteraceae bacterium]